MKVVKEIAKECLREKYNKENWILRISFALSADRSVYDVLPEEYLRKTKSGRI